MKMNLFNESNDFQKLNLTIRKKLISSLNEKIEQEPYAKPVLDMINALDHVERAMRCLKELEI